VISTSDSAGDPVADELSDQVLDAYATRMRRSRGRYYAVIALVVAIVVVCVSIAWSRGEVAHTTLKTAATPAPSVALRAPATSMTRSWTSTHRSAIGTPYWGGTVITHDAHTVRGRDATTGAVTWSYTRSDRTVCTAMQIQGVTVAIYELHGDCDEVTALDSQTGGRDWTRTLDENGQPILGHPSYQVTPYTFMVISPAVIYAIDPAGSGPGAGIDRWVFGEQGCTIHSAVLGSAGALISQTCPNPACAGLTFCHTGPQLLLRDGSNAQNNDDSHKANPDLITWNLAGKSWVPASADQVISAVDPSTGKLMVLDATKGTTRTSLNLSGPTASLATLTAIDTQDLELIWIDGVTYALNQVDGSLAWSASTASPPTVTATTTDGGATVTTPDLAQSIFAAPSASGIALLDPSSGQPERTLTVPAPPAGSSVYPLGDGFVVAGSSTAVYR
jgi:hypothetical protein